MEILKIVTFMLSLSMKSINLRFVWNWRSSCLVFTIQEGCMETCN